MMQWATDAMQRGVRLFSAADSAASDMDMYVRRALGEK